MPRRANTMITIFGHITNGKLTLDKSLLEYATSELAYKDGKPTLIMVEMSRADKRSQAQHRFYFLYLSIISRETGHTVDELHEYFKQEYLEPIKCLVMGKEINMSPSTKTLTKASYEAYMAKIEALTGIPIPDTDGYYQDLLNQSLCD
jgi:hypothetical protein